MPRIIKDKREKFHYSGEIFWHRHGEREAAIGYSLNGESSIELDYTVDHKDHYHYPPPPGDHHPTQERIPVLVSLPCRRVQSPGCKALPAAGGPSFRLHRCNNLTYASNNRSVELGCYMLYCLSNKVNPIYILPYTLKVAHIQIIL